MATSKDVDYGQTDQGNGVSVDARQDQGVFAPTVKPDAQRSADPKGVEVRSAVDQGAVVIDKTEWQVFDEQGLDHGGPHGANSTDILGSGYDAYPGAHNEQFHDNGGIPKL